MHNIHPNANDFLGNQTSVCYYLFFGDVPCCVESKYRLGEKIEERTRVHMERSDVARISTEENGL